MPGVLDKKSVGYIREVGKMASFLHDDLTPTLAPVLSSMEIEEMARSVMDFDQFSPPSSSSSSPSRDTADSELDLSPDFETPVDLLKLMDGDFPGLLNNILDSDDCVDYRSLKVFKKDPFMGHRDDFNEFQSSDSPLGSDAIFGQFNRNSLGNLSPVHQPEQKFSAWDHTVSTTDDDETVLFSGSGSSACSSLNDEHDIKPETPVSYSGTVTGDDSDVDIETIPDTPHSVELNGYTSDGSSDMGPSSPLLQNHPNKISLLQRYSSHLGLSSPKPIRYNSCGVSSSVSLAENLMNGRSIAGKKRKHHKDKYSTSKYHSSSQHSYSSYSFCTTGNSVNFHDYAMSPSSCISTETAQPTVLSNSGSSKRIYKRRQNITALDVSDKDKQNHHNQLERNRRQKLADLFLDLRDEVPSISSQSKASKVMILNQATSYIGDLQRLHRSQDEILSRELHRKETLKKQLRQLEARLSHK